MAFCFLLFAFCSEEYIDIDVIMKQYQTRLVLELKPFAKGEGALLAAEAGKWCMQKKHRRGCFTSALTAISAKK
jgi:hypothetical protein